MTNNSLSGWKLRAFTLATTVSSWFRPKRYGYGLTPMKWQGWLLTGALVVLIAMVARVASS